MFFAQHPDRPCHNFGLRMTLLNSTKIVDLLILGSKIAKGLVGMEKAVLGFFEISVISMHALVVDSSKVMVLHFFVGLFHPDRSFRNL